MSIQQQVLRVVYAEDSADDRLFFERALKKHSGQLQVSSTFQEGQGVIDYLLGKGVYFNREKFPMPDILILDLKMPGVSGYDVLRFLQTNPVFSGKVVVLSGSDRVEDRNFCLAMGAHLYVSKPPGPAGWQEIMKQLENLVQ